LTAKGGAPRTAIYARGVRAASTAKAIRCLMTHAQASGAIGVPSTRIFASYNA